MLLTVSHLSKSFSEAAVISDASFYIEEREKAAIVGINGAGKTTLLKMLTGKMEPDSGQVVFSKDKTMGYLAQHQDLELSGTIYEVLMEVKKDIVLLEKRLRQLEKDMKKAKGEQLDAVMSSYDKASHEFEQKNGYAFRSEINGVLKGLGFLEEEFDRDVTKLSGGQKTRVSLGRLLLSRPDIILLDEPTNHLDLSSIAWLESYLCNYPGSVIIVSHDRFFLDKVVTKVLEVAHSKVTVFTGNYSDYAQKREMLKEAALKAFQNQQAEIRHQEEVITKLRSFNREKSIKRAESREKLLNKIERVEKPEDSITTMHIKFTPAILSGNDVLTIRNLKKQFNQLLLFEHVDIDIKRGERVAVIGDNGTGKTSLLKIIRGLLDADDGEIILGSRVQTGYFDQEHHVLNLEKTIIHEIQDAYPAMTNTDIRNMLAAFGFTEDEVFKLIGSLSGGERGRVSLAKLMLSNANFLILDEPTNHLDMYSKEILEKALSHYEGTILFVSHDRYFINQTATRILELTGQTFISYIGNYDYYLEKKEHLTAIHLSDSHSEDAAKKEVSDTRLSWQDKKNAQAQERKRLNDLKKTEEAIDRLESRNQQIDEEMQKESIATNMQELMVLTNEREENASRLEELYELWEALST